MEAAEKAVVAYHMAGNAGKAYWAASIAAAAHPKTRRVGLRMISYGTRVTFNVARASAGAALGTPLAKGGTTTAGGLLGAAAGGYAAGAAIGTGIAYAGWGRSGAKDAINLYTGQVSVGEYYDTVASAIGKRL